MYLQLKPTMLHLVCLLLRVLHMGSKWKSSVKNSKVIAIILLSDELLRNIYLRLEFHSPNTQTLFARMYIA